MGKTTTTRKPFGMDAGIDHEPALAWIARNARRCVEHAGELAACDDYQVRFAAESLREAAAAAEAEWDRRQGAYLEFDGALHAIGEAKKTIHTGLAVCCVELRRDDRSGSQRQEVWTSDGCALRGGWCECGAQENGFFWTVHPSGEHGWGCSTCRRITQTG